MAMINIFIVLDIVCKKYLHFFICPHHEYIITLLYNIDLAGWLEQCVEAVNDQIKYHKSYR